MLKEQPFGEPRRGASIGEIGSKEGRGGTRDICSRLDERGWTNRLRLKESRGKAMWGVSWKPYARRSKEALSTAKKGGGDGLIAFLALEREEHQKS